MRDTRGDYDGRQLRCIQCVREPTTRRKLARKRPSEQAVIPGLYLRASAA
jgi:hypothetical protein